MAPTDTSGISDPLLNDGNVDVCLEEGLTEDHDFQTLLAARPKEVVQWLQTDGVEKLGAFDIQDHLFYGAKPAETGLLTEGHACKHLHYERFWMSKLCSTATANSSIPPDWSETVTVEAGVVNLRNAAAAENVGLLQPLLRRYQAGAASMMVFGLPCVLATVDFKWEHWCRRMLWVELTLYMIWLFAFNIFTILFQDENADASLADVASSSYGQATISLGALALAAMLPFLYIEAATIVEFGKSWLTIQNIIDGLTYVNQVAITVMYFGRFRLDSDIILVLMAVQCILLWLRLQFYLRVFRASKYAFVDTLRVVLGDVKWFLLFLVFTMWGFACAFHILYRSDQDEVEEFRTTLRSLYTMFTAAAGEFSSEVYLKHHNPGIAVVLMVLYIFIVVVIMLNLLIALLTTSQEKMTENAGLRAVVSKTQIIDELEDTLPGWLKMKGGNRWYPDYIHILKLAKAHREELKPDCLWTGPEELLDKNEEVRMRMRALEIKLDSLQASLDVLLDDLPPNARQRAQAVRSANAQRLTEAREDDDAADRIVEMREE